MKRLGIYCDINTSAISLVFPTEDMHVCVIHAMQIHVYSLHCLMTGLQAAQFFHMKITHIPIDEVTRQVDIKAMERAINRKTCMASTSVFVHIDQLQIYNEKWRSLSLR
jgi:hypothetical protein